MSSNNLNPWIRDLFGENDEDCDEKFSGIDEIDQAIKNEVIGERYEEENGCDDIDMDDEAMLRLDPLIAEAFRSQIKKSSNIKID